VQRDKDCTSDVDVGDLDFFAGRLTRKFSVVSASMFVSLFCMTSSLRCVLCFRIRSPSPLNTFPSQLIIFFLESHDPFAVINMFTGLWMWKESFQHHEQLPVAFNGTWPSWNSDLDNKLW
jgi:hypothetical protein